MSTGRKINRKALILTIVICVVAIVCGIFIAFRPSKVRYQRETATIGDVTTYYSFGGNVEVKERENVIADRMMQVKQLYVREGDQVEKGDPLFQTSYGDDVKSSIDGEVTQLDVDLNSQVMAGTRVIELVNYEDLKVTVRVDEYDIFVVEPGKQVEVTVNALGRTISGTVSKVSREAVNVNGISYFTASIDLESDPDILVGMSTEIKMVKESVSDVVTLSMGALQFDDHNRSCVMVEANGGRPQVRYVTVGLNDGVNVEILDGLKAGDVVLIPVGSKSSGSLFGGEL